MFRKLKKRLIETLLREIPDFKYYRSASMNVKTGKDAKIYYPARLYDVQIGDYSYVGMYSHLKQVDVGKFCSIGPFCTIGWGIHPLNGISTAPMFYSSRKQNGVSLSTTDKVVETKRIIIENDVFIGMNVTILDGVTIGNGAVIGAGAVVSKDIPPYAVAVGNPIRIIKYRFAPPVIEELLRIRWWDFSESDLRIIEEHFFDMNTFLAKANQVKL